MAHLDRLCTVHVTVRSPAPRPTSPRPEVRPPRRAAEALEPWRVGNDVFMVPAPAARTKPDSAEPSRAERLFVGFFEWIGAKLDGL